MQQQQQHVLSQLAQNFDRVVGEKVGTGFGQHDRVGSKPIVFPGLGSEYYEWKINLMAYLRLSVDNRVDGRLVDGVGPGPDGPCN